MTENEKLAEELEKDADAFERIIAQYQYHRIPERMREAARRLKMSARIRTVEAMKQACIDVAVEAQKARGECMANGAARQMAKLIEYDLKHIPLPVEDRGTT